MGWAGLTLVSDTELGQLEPEATAAGAPWGATTWAAARTEAKRDLKILLEADFPDVPGVADRVVDKWNPDQAFGLTGGAYVDYLNELRNDTEDDVPLATIFATFGTDRLYIGANFEFDGLAVVLKDALNAAAAVLTAKYHGPAGWASLSATDGTAAVGATFAKSGRITWTVPSDWQRRTLNGTAEEYFWVELSLSAGLTAGTTASQIVPVRAPDGLKRVTAFLALHHILNGLAAQAAEPDRWEKKAEYYLTKAAELYDKLKTGAALWIDLNRDDVVHQEERVDKPLRLGRA